jgi:hypothetical protein
MKKRIHKLWATLKKRQSSLKGSKSNFSNILLILSHFHRGSFTCSNIWTILFDIQKKFNIWLFHKWELAQSTEIGDEYIKFKEKNLTVFSTFFDDSCGKTKNNFFVAKKSSFSVQGSNRRFWDYFFLDFFNPKKSHNTFFGIFGLSCSECI